ncbi:MAG: alpha/beta hydrolase [Alphaproteobacteria bacterium]|nr:alpha/beta hydrolase [Alphaproteobacteria bacterium]
MTDQFLDIAGARLECRRIAGDPGIPTLVLLHEGLGSVSMWRDFPDKLSASAGAPVFLYSRAGYGKSSPSPLPWPTTYMHREALDVLPRVLDAAGIGDCVLLGHSDGGSIALIHAGGDPHRGLKGVVTMAAHVFNEKVCVDSIAEARVVYEKTDLRQRLMRYHGDNVDNAFRGWNDVWLSEDFWRWNIEEYLPRITVPVLAMQGMDDEYGTESQVDAIVRQVGGRAEKLMLPNCKHSPHRDQPAMVLEAVGRFLGAV